MLIRPENRGRYPADWAQISDRIRFDRAGGRGSRVVLTTAHLNHIPEDCQDENLKGMCQACHLHYDRDHHAHTAKRRRTLEASGQGSLDLGVVC